MSNEGCVICGTVELGPGAEMCEACRAEAGLPPPGVSLRPPNPCARCGHPEIIRVQMRERSSATRGDVNQEQARPFALTWPLSEKFKSFFSSQMVPAAAPQLEGLFGLLEAYVCRACGATELFTRDPGRIPIGAPHGTELIVAQGDAYR